MPFRDGRHIKIEKTRMKRTARLRPEDVAWRRCTSSGEAYDPSQSGIEQVQRRTPLPGAAMLIVVGALVPGEIADEPIGGGAAIEAAEGEEEGDGRPRFFKSHLEPMLGLSPGQDGPSGELTSETAPHGSVPSARVLL